MHTSTTSPTCVSGLLGITAHGQKKVLIHRILYFASSDPVVASLAQDIFKELAQIEGCQGPMQMRLIPTLVSIMQAPPDKIPSGLCAVR